MDGELRRVRIAKKLALVKGTTKARARELARPTLNSVNESRRYDPETAVKLLDFVKGENYVNGEIRITQSIWHGHVCFQTMPATRWIIIIWSTA